MSSSLFLVNACICACCHFSPRQLPEDFYFLMPRSRRISLVGYPHTVVARTEAEQLLFGDTADYEFYLDLLQNLRRDNLANVYAFCLLPSEVRLVVEPLSLSLGKIIQRLHTAYARHREAKYNRNDPLFQERFHSVLFERKLLPDAVRAVHLCPVRTGKVRRVDAHPWSSHKLYVQANHPKGALVDIQPVMQHFGGQNASGIRTFGVFIEAAALEADSLGLDEIMPGVAGDAAFAEQILAETATLWRKRRKTDLSALLRRAALVVGVPIEDIKGPNRQQNLVAARRLFATAAVNSAGRSVSEIALFLGRDKGQVSRLVQQGMQLAETDEAFRALLLAVKGGGKHHAHHTHHAIHDDES